MISVQIKARVNSIALYPQVHGGRKSLSMYNAFTYMLREGGVIGLWRGNGINVIKVTSVF